MKNRCFTIAAGIFLSLPISLMAGDKPDVQLTGLQIIGSGYGLNGSELKAFNQQSGTSIALIVQAPENKKIVEVERSKCSLSEFTDDHGHDLLNGVSWSPFPEVSTDGELALIEVESKNRPSQGASKLSAKGTIRLLVAASSATTKIENLKLQVGTEAKVDNKVIQVMKVEQESDRLNLVLQMNRQFVEKMKDIRFYTEADESLEIWGRGSFTFGNVSQMEYNIETDSIPETLVVEIDLWQELESITLPFEIGAGVGF